MNRTTLRHVHHGRERLLLDGIPLLCRAVENTGCIDKLDLLAAHHAMADDDTFGRERVGRYFRFRGRYPADERGLPHIRVAGNDNGEGVIHMREHPERVPHLIEEPQVLVYLVDHGREPGNCPLAHDKSIIRFPGLQYELVSHHLGMFCSPPYRPKGLPDPVKPVQDVSHLTVKRRDFIEFGKAPYDIDQTVMDCRSNCPDELGIGAFLVGLLLHFFCRTAETPVQDLVSGWYRRHFLEFHKSPTYI